MSALDLGLDTGKLSFGVRKGAIPFLLSPIWAQGTKHWQGRHEAWVLIPAVPLVNSVTTGKSLSLSEPLFSSSENGADHTCPADFTGSFTKEL